MSHCPQCFAHVETRQGNWCNPCKNALMRRNRAKYRDLSPEEKMKDKCRSQAQVAQRRGAIIPEACQRCGAERAQKHHPDYSRPLLVVWLCRQCHNILHKQERDEDKAQTVELIRKHLTPTV